MYRHTYDASINIVSTVKSVSIIINRHQQINCQHFNLFFFFFFFFFINNWFRELRCPFRQNILILLLTIYLNAALLLKAISKSCSVHNPRRNIFEMVFNTKLPLMCSIKINFNVMGKFTTAN